MISCLSYMLLCLSNMLLCLIGMLVYPINMLLCTADKALWLCLDDLALCRFDAFSIKRIILSNWHVDMSKFRVVVEKRRTTLTCPHTCKWRSLSMCVIINFRLRFAEHRSNIYIDNLYIILHRTSFAANNILCGDEHAYRSRDLIKIICILF